MRKTITIAASFALLLAACGGSGEGTPAGASDPATADNAPDQIADAEAYPIFASSEVVVGSNRFLIGVRDQNDAPIGSRDLEVSVSFEPQGDGTPTPTLDTEFLETVPGQRGLYVAKPEFDAAGPWTATVSISGDGIDETISQELEVAEESTTPAIGAPAPASDTATAGDVDSLKEISTAKKPDPRFYEVSIKEALAEGEPFVVVFATPKFCSSQVCGPTLDDVAKVMDDFPEVTVIHSEIYEGLEPNNPPVAAVTEWGLPSEPWVFVVDSDGKVAAKYEGSVGHGELRSALKDI